MLKKTITFKDLDGNDVTDDFYFNLNKAELAEMELSYPGGLAKHLEYIIESGDTTLVVPMFKKLLSQTIGRRHADGRRFEKSAEIWRTFEETNAYEVLFLELISDATAAAEFLKGCMPADLAEQIETVPLPKNVHAMAAPVQDNRPAWIREDREPTKAELQSMSLEEMREVFARKMSFPGEGKMMTPAEQAEYNMMRERMGLD